MLAQSTWSSTIEPVPGPKNAKENDWAPITYQSENHVTGMSSHSMNPKEKLKQQNLKTNDNHSTHITCSIESQLSTDNSGIR